MSAVPLTPDHARARLGLGPDAAAHEVIGAFRTAAKAAHPDRSGGDAARFREVLEAYRLLQSLPRLPALVPPDPSPVLEAHVEIPPMTAILGGEAEAVMGDGRRVRVRIPAGARHGERLCIGDEPVSVRLGWDAALQVRGSDLWVTAEIPFLLFQYGGRAGVVTPLGERQLWISRKTAERGLARIEGEGMPARGPHPQGSLYIRLVPDTGAPESPARAQLRRFAAAWAA